MNGLERRLGLKQRQRQLQMVSILIAEVAYFPKLPHIHVGLNYDTNKK